MNKILISKKNVRILKLKFSNRNKEKKMRIVRAEFTGKISS